MITQFRFIHEGKQIIAELVFNFTAITDMILILPLSLKAEIGEYILFTQLKDENWITDAPLVKNFPSTYQSVAENLNTFFKKYNFPVIN